MTFEFMLFRWSDKVLNSIGILYLEPFRTKALGNAMCLAFLKSLLSAFLYLSYSDDSGGPTSQRELNTKLQ